MYKKLKFDVKSESGKLWTWENCQENGTKLDICPNVILNWILQWSLKGRRQKERGQELPREIQWLKVPFCSERKPKQNWCRMVGHAAGRGDGKWKQGISWIWAAGIFGWVEEPGYYPESSSCDSTGRSHEKHLLNCNQWDVLFKETAHVNPCPW